ncbi:unnamed protein product [Rotaria socialis]|uniref:G-protein coupled receptors family 1 profile domain-containing protein n=1 Tax=Rotaria socialis TaxID=392032 RepID=A0A818TIN8_9BILA|nr:unnamed protein product [Rotaria socialis]CAF3403397.1 unnamed protein product [Rotaria socialis]CAF3416621.1 unnamed protein product [Rotaria socialis]CAF3436721.1 unnamed protein product [Rotaria socialis]CAF3685283.1 unnamed protein product [Rotaria socialis]
MADSIYYQLSLYTQPLLIILGTIGVIFNQILFFSRKSLRATSCSLYFRAHSFNDFLVLYIYVLMQWIADQYGYDPTSKYNWYCKTKTYVETGLYTLSPYFVVLACFDRLCVSSSNSRIRKVATIRIASYLIPCMTVLVFAAYFHIPIWYLLVSYPTGSVCTVVNFTYIRIYAVFLVIFLGFMPPCLMIVLCSIAFVLLRQRRRQIMPINQARLRQRDNQLLKMLFLYVACHLICTIPFSIVLVIAVYQIPTPSATVILLFRLFILLFNINFSTSFYIYTLGTPFYRHELCCLIKDIYNRLNRMIYNNNNQLRLQVVDNLHFKRT